VRRGWADGGYVSRDCTFTYDDDDGVYSRTGADGVTTTVTLDKPYRIASAVMSNGLEVEYSYYDNGLLEYAVYGNGTQTHYEYDGARRLAKMTHEVTATSQSFKVLEYDWYDNDLLAEIHEPQPGTELLDAGPTSYETTQFFYDNRGRLIREHRFGADEYTSYHVYDLRYTYDQVGNRLTKEDVYGYKDVAYDYDVDDTELYGSCSNRLMHYTIDDEYDNDDEEVWYTYDYNGNVTRVIRRYADEDQYRSTWLVYDSGGRVRNVIGETWNDDGLDWWTGGEAGYEYALTEDANTWADARGDAQSRGGDLAQCLVGDGCEWIYTTFDPGIEDQHWLGAAQESGSNGIEPDQGWHWTISGCPIYPEDPWLPGAPNDGDPGENCTTSGGSSHTACRDYDVAALVYNYDAGTAGVIGGFDDIDEETELQAIIQREVGDVCSDGVMDYTRTYAWEFRYDGARQRYLRREVHPGDFGMLSEEWSDYDGSSVYADFVLDSGVTGGAHSVRDYLTGEGHADSSTSGVWDGEAYYHGNQIGSTRVMTDGTPSVVRSYVYDAFGNVYDTSGTATTRYRYAGAWGYQSHDDFPFLHVGARYYDPETGRFLQRDPIGIAGGLNVYTYVGSNPASSVDPDGRMSLPPWVKVGAETVSVVTIIPMLVKIIYYKMEAAIVDAGVCTIVRAEARRAITEAPRCKRFGTFQVKGHKNCVWMKIGDAGAGLVSISYTDEDNHGHQFYDRI